MQLNVINANGQSQGGEIEVSDSAFAAKYNEPLIHQVVVAYQAGARAGTSAQKSRAQVSGGGAKPWRQKGTGRARFGSSRNPIWRSGGQTFASSPRDYTQKVNRKMYRAAMASILSELVRQERLLIVDELNFDKPETKTLKAVLDQVGVSEVLIVVEGDDMNLALSARNLPHVDVLFVCEINPVSLVAYEKIITTPAAAKAIEGSLS